MIFTIDDTTNKKLAAWAGENRSHIETAVRNLRRRLQKRITVIFLGVRLIVYQDSVYIEEL